MSDSSPDKNEEGFGDMTRAWMDAGAEVADYEAGRAAERRRLVVGFLAVVTIIGSLIGAAVWFLA